MQQISRDKLFILGIFFFFISSSFLWKSIMVTRILQLICIVVFTLSFRVKPEKNTKFPRLYKILILLVLLWGILIIIRGDNYDHLAIVRKVCSADGVFEYIAPLLLFFPLYKYFNYTLNITTKILYLYIILVFMNLPMIIYRGDGIINIISILYSFLGGSLPFLIIFFNYLSRKQKVIVTIATFVVGVIAIWLARRGMLLGLLSAYLFYLLIWLLKQRHLLIKLIFISMAGMIIYCYLLPMLLNLSFLQSITTKGFDDTRTLVEEYLWDDISQDFNTVLYGVGIDGAYYAPNIDTIADYRYSIETGYLHLLLKGGVVYLILMGLIFLLPIIKGLFRGRSTMSKCASLYLLHCVCMMYPGNPCRFLPTYFLMWLCVSLIYSENSKKQIQT